MSDIPLIIRETPSCNSPRRAYQMGPEDYMSEMEKFAVVVEHYKVLKNRAINNPLFLPRNLSYRIEAKRQRRIQMTVSLPDTIDQKLFPLHILLARMLSPKPIAEHSAVYEFSRECILTGVDGVSQGQATFLLPDMERLTSKAYSGSLDVLCISFAGEQNSEVGIDSSKIHPENIEGHGLWSNIPLKSLYPSWQKYPLNLGQKANSVSLVEMQPCFIKLKSNVVIQVPSTPLTSSSPQQVQVTISAKDIGPTKKSD